MTWWNEAGAHWAWGGCLLAIVMLLAFWGAVIAALAALVAGGAALIWRRRQANAPVPTIEPPRVRREPAQPAAPQPEPAEQPAPRPAAPRSSSERNELLHVGAALTALAVWLAWAAQLATQTSIAWDGGTGPAQTQNLVALYGPAVLALLATLIAINPPSHGQRA